MQAINLLELIPRCHAGSRAKGFWDVTPNKGQQLMLVVSELAEALEADRKGRRASAEVIAYCKEWQTKGWEWVAPAFEGGIKDTVEDELADAYIRLCDYAGGFGLALDALTEEFELLDCPDNLGEALLGITAVICMAEYDPMNEEGTVGMALAHIEALCQKRGIDLATHIDLKLRYNATRPAKHGKAY